jgi:hypothetical protein
MKFAPGSSRSRNSRSKKKNREWHGRTDLVTYDVFKRMYWSHLPRSSTKGLCTSYVTFPLQILTYPCYKASSLAFGEFVGMATHSPSFPQLLPFPGTIKGSEKALDYPNRALDRDAYENLRNTHKVEYSLFEAYQTLKSKRGERDLADRYVTLCTVYGYFITPYIS